MSPPAPPERADLVDEADLERLVRSFYGRAAQDELLGPVFAAAGLDWEDHLRRVRDFWAWQLLGGRYEGRPLHSHLRAARRSPFTPELYARWLELFRATLREGWSGPVADLAEARAVGMAESMRRELPGGATVEPNGPRPAPEGPGAPRAGGVSMRVALGRRPERPRDDGPSDPGGSRPPRS